MVKLPIGDSYIRCGLGPRQVTAHLLLASRSWWAHICLHAVQDFPILLAVVSIWCCRNTKREVEEMKASRKMLHIWYAAGTISDIAMRSHFLGGEEVWPQRRLG